MQDSLSCRHRWKLDRLLGGNGENVLATEGRGRSSLSRRLARVGNGSAGSHDRTGVYRAMIPTATDWTARLRRELASPSQKGSQVGRMRGSCGSGEGSEARGQGHAWSGVDGRGRSCCWSLREGIHNCSNTLRQGYFWNTHTNTTHGRRGTINAQLQLSQHNYKYWIFQTLDIWIRQMCLNDTRPSTWQQIESNRQIPNACTSTRHLVWRVVIWTKLCMVCIIHYLAACFDQLWEKLKLCDSESYTYDFEITKFGSNSRESIHTCLFFCVLAMHIV